MIRTFKEFLEMVAFNKFQFFGIDLKPNTFGIEIEFRMSPEDSFEMQKALDDYRNSESQEAFDKWFRPKRQEYRFFGAVYRKIGQVEKKLESIGIKGWKVFEDERDVIEISSAILSADDIPKVRQLFEILKDEKFDHKTGAHIHVGVPPTTDAFDLLAMAWLLDENHILRYADRTQESLDDYAKSKNQFFDIIYDQFLVKNNQYEIDNQELFQVLEKVLDRHYGLNTIKAFAKHKTIELRFLSSRIVSQPDIFFEIVRYLMVLPQIASRKKQINVKCSKGVFSVTRQPGKVVFSTNKVRQSGLPVDSLRSHGIMSLYSNR